jgi:hypothetical protein
MQYVMADFAVTALRTNDQRQKSEALIAWLLEQEEWMELGTPRPCREFERRVYRHRLDLVRLLKYPAAEGKRVVGYGASTKGNVLLQCYELMLNEVIALSEVNEEKFGAFTAGTHIPIISEARAMRPDYSSYSPGISRIASYNVKRGSWRRTGA